MKMHLILGFAMTVLLGQSSAKATSFFIRPFSQFTQTAPNVVRGTISNIHVENGITDEGAKTIFTYANLDVKEVLKGTITTAQISIRKIGGSKDGVTLEIPSSPDFIEGEDTVLFLSSQQNDKSYEVTGLELGKFGIKEVNGEQVLTGGLFSYSKTPSGGEDQHNLSAGDLSENRRPWSLGQVREMIQKQGSNPPAASPSPNLTRSEPKTMPTQNGQQPIEIYNKNNDSPQNYKNFSTTEPEKTGTSVPYYWGVASILAIALFLYFRGR